jgi:redox-sensing transcriptional repressor
MLKNLLLEGRDTVSSEKLAEALGLSSDVVRKDFSYLGQFGHSGIGYDTKRLYRSVCQILGLDRSWNLAIAGAGNLGSALCAYKGFSEQGFHVVALFDVEAKKVRKEFAQSRVYHIAQLAKIIQEKKIEIGILAVPANAAQEVADKFVQAGIRAILNFAPTKVATPENVKVVNIDLSSDLVSLTHFLS